jgi:hypothetical protein
MTVYLKIQGQLFNLNLTPNIRTENTYVMIGEFGVSCKYKEVAHQLFEDITLALIVPQEKAFVFPVDTLIEPFTGEDKYSQQIKAIEAVIEEKEKQDLLNRVLDAVEKKATRCFIVTANVDYDADFAPNPFRLNERVFAKDKQTVEAWLRQKVCKKKSEYGNILKEESLKITPEPKMDIFYCHAYLDYGSQDKIRFIYKEYDRFLDAKDYELEKETV